VESFGPIAPHYDLLMATVPYRMWAEYFKLLLTRQGNPALKILDVCCGTGSVAEMLTFDGYSVTGFDLSPEMIASAREKATERNLAIRYEVADARDFELNDTFEAAFSFFDSLNYIADLDGFRAAISQVAKHLEPEGSFIFDLNTAYAFENEMFSQSDMRKNSMLKYKWDGRYDPAARIIRVEMDFWKEGEHLQEVHVQRAHSEEEVRAALTDAGFGEIELYESYTLRKPRKSTDRVHYVARLLS
jgi:SAM-dependent methyltransferase